MVVEAAEVVVVVAPLLSASSLALRGKAKVLVARAAMRIEKCMLALLFVEKLVKMSANLGNGCIDL